MNLKEIFDVITPENIKDIPLLQAAMEVFIENLEENAQISQDIKKIYDNEFKDSDPELIQDSKTEIRKALLDTYITALYNTLTKAQSDKVIKAKLAASKDESDNYPFLHDIDTILNQEYFVTNKAVKQKKGTKVGIEYAYNLAKYLETAENANDFNLKEEKPFHFRTDGSIYREMYENIVKPLSHPLGFTYTYSQIIKETISDIFGIEITFDVNSVEIRSLTGTFDVFTERGDDLFVKRDFLDRINPLTGALFTEEEYDAQVVVHTGKIVESFTDETVDERNKRSLLFTDGTFIQQLTNPLEILYQEYEDFNAGNNITIKDFDGHYSLFVEYESDVRFTYEDDIERFENTFYITNVKEENEGNAGDQFYSISSVENSFNVGGDTYNFAPGNDESVAYYNDETSINSEIDDKFRVQVTGSVADSLQDGLIDITIRDLFGHSKTESGLTSFLGDYNCTFNTYDLQGDYYEIETVVTYENIEYVHKFTNGGLNDFNREFEFTEVEDNNHVSGNTIRIAGNAPINTQIFLTLTDSNGDTVTGDVTSNGLGEWETALVLVGLETGDFTIDAKTYLPNGKLDINKYFKGSDLRVYRENVLVKSGTIDYTYGTPSYAGLLDSTEIANTDLMDGVDSIGTTIIHQIAELAEDDTFAPADKKISDYLTENGIELDQIPEELTLVGAYIEGNDYDRSFANYLSTEETFINYDRKLFPIDTSDYIVMTSDQSVTESLLIFGLSTTGYYLFTEEPDDIDFYLYTTDEFYLTTLGDDV